MKGSLAALALAVAASAAHAQVATGDYIAEHGWGTLKVKNGGFEILAVGGNGHTCSLDGKLKGMTATLDDAGDICRIAFAAKDGGYQVTPTTPETCRAYCGARAYFEGLYLKPARGCADGARAKTRKAFKAAYDAKDYAKAARLLAPQLSACARTLGPMETAGLRNDLAIAQYHLGRKEECLKTLAPLAEQAGRKDDDLQPDYPPSDWEEFKPLLKATRINLALCRS
ncbi:MAG TPA: hypothetical protein PKA55_05345 [Rhodoblastus sp.]|nr:hypothetical protein [Rhodoblastus sp.]